MTVSYPQPGQNLLIFFPKLFCSNPPYHYDRHDFVLAEIGVNIGPITGQLPCALVWPIVFGGHKNWVQDVITRGVSQMENAIYAGDIVTAGGITGTALKKLTIPFVRTSAIYPVHMQ